MLRVPHAKPVMLLRGEAEVLHTGLFGQIEPHIGIEVNEIELPREEFVFVTRNILLSQSSGSVLDN
jgi:hypothetical protein